MSDIDVTITPRPVLSYSIGHDNDKAYVVHNSDPGFARPLAASVDWYGTFYPNNMVDGDYWINPNGGIGPYADAWNAAANLTNWTKTVDTQTLSWVSAGLLTGDGSGETIAVPTYPWYLLDDVEVTFPVTTSAASRTGDFETIFKWTDANNYLSARWAFTDGAVTLTIRKKDLGVDTQLATVALAAPAFATTYWLRVRCIGNIIGASLLNGDPYAGGAVIGSILAYTLAGANATKYGINVVGNVGFRYAAGAVDWRMGRFNCRVS